MTGFTKFRSSVGGFNRVDVTNYIEKLSVEHTAALKKLEKENAALSQRLSHAESELQSKSARTSDLEQKLSQAETALASTEAALEEAMALVVEQPTEATPDYTALELEAYGTAGCRAGCCSAAESAESAGTNRRTLWRYRAGDSGPDRGSAHQSPAAQRGYVRSGCDL